MTLRTTTNLVIPQDLKLPKDQAGAGFMYIYANKYTGPEPIFMARIWLAALFPSVPKSPTFGRDGKSIRAYATLAAKMTPAGYLKLRKVNGEDPHFEASLPMYAFNPHSIQELGNSIAFRLDPAATDDHRGTADNEAANVSFLVKDKLAQMGTKDELLKSVYTKEAVLAATTLDVKAKHELSKCLINVTLEYKGSLAIVYMNLRINKAEAEQLTTTNWLEIRNMDLYPLLMTWVINQYGYLEKAPLASFPISKIARTMPAVKEGQARVNAEGIAIGPKGTPFFLPKALDNTRRYEDQFSLVGDRQDGSFSILDLGEAAKLIEIGKEVVARLPPNIPVLMDWVNNKYAYTTTSGVMTVQDLVRFRAADATHIVTLLTQTEMTVKLVGQFAALGAAGGVVSSETALTRAEWDALKDSDELRGRVRSETLAPLFERRHEVDEYFAVVAKFWTQITDLPNVRMHDVSAQGAILLRPVARFIKAAYQGVLDNIDAVYSKYSVSYVSQTFAWLAMVARYADNFEEIKSQDQANRKAAIDQEVTPGWTVPSIPMITESFGFLPHQEKVRNLLKDSPQFAILPVQAGGGKTPLIITDTLLEIKANRSAPYLILCPPGLVAQYVKDIVYFTSGQLNVVPFNTYVIKHNGFARVKAMLTSAPRNTVVVCDYDVLRYRQQQVCYGTSTQTVFPVIEFLRQFDFQYVALDESHTVKNDSGRTRACMALITDIPKKRLASGTMAHDSPSDLAMQIGMLDPTLFGTREEMNDKYGEVVRGDRVIRWKPGAQKAIMAAIKSRIVVAGAMRREWAALLPEVKELFHGVALTPAQYAVYSSILEETLEKIKEEAKTNKGLAKFVNNDKENPEEAADETAGEGLEALLKPYLARLEQFITAPARDPLGERLTGEDAVSPKVTEIIKIIKGHLDANIPGKILVFTNYTESAVEIYERLPDDLKAQAILYLAADKVEAGAEFENNPKKTIMIGVEQSMNTGLNLQFASRLIRTEAVWNPGTEEQGNSRINRPELKHEDRRTKVYFDRVIADRTIDITKVSRLMSKIIATAKFENADSGIYDGLEDVEVIPMTLDSIQNLNSWTTDLKAYGEVYSQYKRIQLDDYAAYKAEHGALKLHPVEHAPLPADAMLMGQVPYTPGLELHGADVLGLVRLDHFLRSDEAPEVDEGGSDADNGDEEEGPDSEVKEGPAPTGKDSVEKRKQQNAVLKGQAVHTEFGEGVLRGLLHNNRVMVDYDNGTRVALKRAAVFLVTKSEVAQKDIRTQLLTHVGEMKITEKINIVGPSAKRDAVSTKRERERLEKEAAKKKAKVVEMSLELQFSVTNGFLGISYFIDDKHPDAASALQALGFRPAPDFVYASFSNAARLMKQFNLWREKGFTLDEAVNKVSNLSGSIRDMYDLLKNGKIKNHNAVYRYSTVNKLTNFYRMELKTSTERKVFKPFPIIEDGEAFIVLPIRGQAGTRQAIKVRAPGVVWTRSEPSLVYYGLNVGKISEKMREIIGTGIQISNVKDLQKEFGRLKKAKLRDEEAEALGPVGPVKKSKKA